MMDGSEQSKLLIAMFPYLFTRLEKQYSTKMAGVQPSVGDEVMLGRNMRSKLISIPRLGKVGDELSKLQR